MHQALRLWWTNNAGYLCGCAVRVNSQLMTPLVATCDVMSRLCLFDSIVFITTYDRQLNNLRVTILGALLRRLAFVTLAGPGGGQG